MSAFNNDAGFVAALDKVRPSQSPSSPCIAALVMFVMLGPEEGTGYIY